MGMGQSTFARYLDNGNRAYYGYGNDPRLVRSAYAPRSNGGPKMEMVAKNDWPCKFQNCGDRSVTPNVTVIVKRDGQWGHKECPKTTTWATAPAAAAKIARQEFTATMKRYEEEDRAVAQMDVEDEQDAIYDALEEYHKGLEQAARAAAHEQFMVRKLIYRVSLTGEAKKYGVDVVNVEAVPNEKWNNVKVGEFKGVGVGTVRQDGTIRYWNDVDQNDARVQAVVAAVNILMNAADPIEFAKAYALESKECMRCGETLVDDQNKYYPLLGPVCGRKFNKGE